MPAFVLLFLLWSILWETGFRRVGSRALGPAVGPGTVHYLRGHMQIKKIEVKNFRLLKNVELFLEGKRPPSTVCT